MAKMNQPIRMTKAVTGHKSATPIKGDTANYKITTGAGDTTVEIRNTSGTLIESFSSLNLKDAVRLSKEFLKSVGVKFPILTAKTLVAEVQLVAFSATPDGGSFRLVSNGNQTTLLTNSATNANVQTALRAISGLEEVTVAGSYAAGFTVTFTGVVGDVSMLTTANNTLVNGVTPVVITITEVTPGS